MASIVLPSARVSKLGSPSNSAMLAPRPLTQARHPTPESEAIASSDEEHDGGGRRIATPQATAATKPVRRSSSSWLSEVQATGQRKFSMSGVSFASTNSQPPTPSGEQGPWSSSRQTSYPWNNIWSQEARKDPPSRLTEVVQSPTSMQPDDVLPSPKRESGSEAGAIPFTIPLQPIRKAVRSQSYSVGQIDDDTGSPSAPAYQAQGFPRGRVGTLPALRHRPSRPSLLSDNLGQVREDDDDESSTGSEQGVKLPGSGRSDLPAESGSSALLKQAAVARHRAATTGSPSGRFRSKLTTRAATFSESDYAIEEVDDDFASQELPEPKGTILRRMSEFAPSTQRTFHTLVGNEHRDDSSKRIQWHSSLGYPGENQSRRHSVVEPSVSHSSFFADPTSDDNDHLASGLGPTLSAGDLSRQTGLRSGEEPSYFSGHGPGARSMEASSAMLNPTAPFVNPYSFPSVMPKRHQHLYVVSFKCARSDVFYIPDGTGLEVKKGDMVIVEGDRGIDLGTVTHADVTEEEAKRLKDDAALQHYRWLMMFSRHVQSTTTGPMNPSGMMAASGGEVGTIGGMGPRPAHHASGHGHEQELKPKMIKRLAQNHEIQLLRDKEGNEAKAKRVCQSKVLEHGLNMEILDAEYQLDFKKLTFFYYAESYINFNDLVTDLFKVYKTRIWMSAINPASFSTPSGGLAPLIPPTGVAPGATTSHRPAVASSLAVGPGFGQEVLRHHDQFAGGAVRPPTGFDSGLSLEPNAGLQEASKFYSPFMHQLGQMPIGYHPPGYPSPTWGQSFGFGRYSPYPVPANGASSPYVGYPPSTFPASPASIQGPSQRNGHTLQPKAAQSVLDQFQGLTVGGRRSD